MILGRVTKKANETRRYLIDFGKLRLNAGEYIVTSISAVAPDTVPALSTSISLIQDIIGDLTSVRSSWLYVGAGVQGTQYKITITTVPDDSLILWEDEIEILVE